MKDIVDKPWGLAVVTGISALLGYIVGKYDSNYLEKTPPSSINPKILQQLSETEQVKLASSLNPAVISNAFTNFGDQALLPTYRNKKIQTFNSKGRPFAHVGVFPSTNLGAIGYVFAKTTDGNIHVLLTQQMRNVNGVRTLVLEPPAGFINPPYDDETPHVVVEYAERKIDLWQRDNRNKDASREKRMEMIETFYSEARYKYQNNELDTPYHVDTSLQQTAQREISEETGLEAKILESAMTQLFSEELTDKGVYLARFAFCIDVDELPKLAVNESTGEVNKAIWVDIKSIKFELTNGEVSSASALETPIKPYDKHPQMLHKAIGVSEGLVCKVRSKIG